jgi:urease accessory protein
MGSRVIDPERDRVPAIEGLPVLDRVETSACAPDAPVGVLRLPFDARSRSRLRARLEDGTEVALVLPRGTVLRDGAIVSGAGLRVRVLAADEDVLEVRADSPIALARVAYHLGNRHVPVEVGADRLLLGYDSVLADMLIGLGARLSRTWSPFEPEGGAYGHGH